MPGSEAIVVETHGVRRDHMQRLLLVLKLKRDAAPFIRIEMTDAEARRIRDALNDILCMGGN